ncbi:MAG: aspartate kinase [Eubacteriales bacterium]|nr:aspartate kinase [Eubacteriales bacterium]
MITVKFGGTSLADAQRIRHAADIIRANPDRRFVVVSAPGKRFPEDTKITDHLIRFQASGDPRDFQPVEERFEEIIRELDISLDLSADYDEMKNEPHNADYMASCGEYLSARIMAAYLGWPFVDTEFCVFFDEKGRLDRRRTNNTLQEKLGSLEHAVLPGYYGAMPDGQVHTFSRGGSDISGALVAAAMGADTYENWTDVDGMLTADPRIVPTATTIPAITYAELEEMAYQGATVLHEEAVRPAWDAGIPIHIRNTFRPEADGTWIRSENIVRDNPVTGVAGRKGFSILHIEKEKMNAMVGYVRKTLSCLERHHVAFEHMATGLSSFSLVVSTASLADCRETLEWEIQQEVDPDALTISDGFAMIAVVGCGMIDRPGIAGKLFSALGDIGANVRMIDQGGSQMSIVLGVTEDCYEDSVQAIYDRFFINMNVL